MKLLHRLLLTWLTVGTCGASATITVPSDGSLVPLPATSSAAEPRLDGEIAAEEVTPYSYTVDFGRSSGFFVLTLYGAVHSRVVLAADGTYDFYWRILPLPLVKIETISLPTEEGPFPVRVDDGPFFSELEGISSFELAWPDLDVVRAGWRTDEPGEFEPQRVGFRGGRHGDQVVFAFEGAHYLEDFGSHLLPNQESRFFFLDTDARAYAKNGSFSLFSTIPAFSGGRSQPYSTFAPVPEPTTWALLMLGLGALAMVGRRRRASLQNPSAMRGR